MHIHAAHRNFTWSLLYSMMITLTPWIYNLSVPVQVSCMSECYMGNYDQEVWSWYDKPSICKDMKKLGHAETSCLLTSTVCFLFRKVTFLLFINCSCINDSQSEHCTTRSPFMYKFWIGSCKEFKYLSYFQNQKKYTRLTYSEF